MRRKLKIFVYVTIFIVVFVIMFVPFVNTSDEYHIYCRYRLAVYVCWPIDSEGEGYNESDSDTFIGNIILEEKIGGPLEYFGLKEIKKDSINKLK
ncbi:hypothetical protein [Flavobacterium sp.]|jgi:hypothetical protein|uniref:hypothetical protein n=1 Tax=Flavobacterium sp. TaxID=239 RepID=UPI0039198897